MKPLLVLRDAAENAIRHLRALLNWLPWLRKTRGYRVLVVEDLPSRLKPNTLYVVGEGPVAMYASMACPVRRCGEVLNMNLLPDDHPVWTLRQDADGRPSLRPSVWRKATCGCHFWLRDGELHWC